MNQEIKKQTKQLNVIETVSGKDAGSQEKNPCNPIVGIQGTLTHYHNQTTLICRADGSYWFGASKYFVMHLRAKR